MYPTYPKNYFRINILLQKYMATYVPYSYESIYNKIFFYTYNTLWAIYTIGLYIPWELMKFHESTGNIIQLIEYVGMLVTHLLLCFKLVTWFTKRKLILNMMDQLNLDDYKYNDYKDFKPGRQIYEHQKMFYKLFALFITVAVMVPLSKTIDGAYNYYKKINFIDGVNLRCQSILPYYARFPFETENKYGCRTALIIQAFPMIFMGLQIVAYDMLFLNLCIYIRAHLINIQGAFRTIRGRCLQDLNLPENYAIFRDEDNEVLKSKMLMEMRKVTVHLQKIIEVCEEMENIFTFVSLSQTMVTLSVMVSCLFVMSMEPLFSPSFTSQLDYLLAIYIQLAFYCVFGNEITDQSAAIANAIYECDWISAPKSFKTTMLINMLRMRKPLVLTIGKFSPLTLATLLTVLRGSYSYFTVLKQQA